MTKFTQKKREQICNLLNGLMFYTAKEVQEALSIAIQAIQNEAKRK